MDRWSGCPPAELGVEGAGSLGGGGLAGGGGGGGATYIYLNKTVTKHHQERSTPGSMSLLSRHTSS